MLGFPEYFLRRDGTLFLLDNCVPVGDVAVTCLRRHQCIPEIGPIFQLLVFLLFGQFLAANHQSIHHAFHHLRRPAVRLQLDRRILHEGMLRFDHPRGSTSNNSWAEGRWSGSFTKHMDTKFTKVDDQKLFWRRRGGGRFGIMKMTYDSDDKGESHAHRMDITVGRLSLG